MTVSAGERVGVLGGTFDPPHLAHLALAAAAKTCLDLDRVVFLTAGDPWRKRDREGLTPAPTRLRLVQAAVADLPWAEVSDLEVRRPGPSYTSVTVEELTAGGGAWWFVLGEDTLQDMPRWHEPRRIVAQARLAVARRADAVGELVTPALRVALPGVDDQIDVVAMPPLALSSSKVRARVRDGRPTALLLPEPVRALVDELGLYRAPAA